MEHIQQLRKTLQSWKRSRRFLGYHESFDFSHQVDDITRLEALRQQHGRKRSFWKRVET